MKGGILEMSCKYYEEKEFICGWKDHDTPYYYKGGVCMAQKGAPRVGCKGDEDQCENLDHRRAELYIFTSNSLTSPSDSDNA